MLLDILGTKFHAQVLDEGTVNSLHTGAQLSHVTASVVIHGNRAHEDFLAQLATAANSRLGSLDDNGATLKQWKVARSSWNFLDGSQVYKHTLELHENEDLHLDRLELGDLVIIPSLYDESFGPEGYLTIQARISASETQEEKLRVLRMAKGYFPVIRHGISDRPRQMRFVTSHWAKGPDGYQHNIYLVDKQADELPDEATPAFVQMTANRETVAELRAGVTGLIELLRAKGVLNSEEIAGLSADTAQRMSDIKIGLSQVSEIDL